MIRCLLTARSTGGCLWHESKGGLELKLGVILKHHYYYVYVPHPKAYKAFYLNPAAIPSHISTAIPFLVPVREKRLNSPFLSIHFRIIWIVHTPIAHDPKNFITRKRRGKWVLGEKAIIKLYHKETLRHQSKQHRWKKKEISFYLKFLPYSKI